MRARTFVLLVSAVSVAVACSTQASPGQMTITVNGKQQTVAIIQNGGTANNAKIDVSGGTVTTHNGARWYIGNENACPDRIQASDVRVFPLLGASFGWTNDFSQLGCGCNGAVYLVRAPAKDAGGNPTDGNQDYYCDANNVGNHWCPELDLAEGNKAAFAWTPHKCNPPNNGHYESCDRWGCGNNLCGSGDYGSNGGKTINTNQPFDVKFDFYQSGGQFSDIKITLTQGSSVFTRNYDSNRDCYMSPEVGGGSQKLSQYLAAMTDDVRSGMAFTISDWGGAKDDGTSDNWWLDNPTDHPGSQCTNEREICDKNGAFIFKNFWYCADMNSCSQSAESSAPPPPKDCTLQQDPHATGMGSCSSSVASGKSCNFDCATDYTPVSGTCDDGTWSPTPYCKSTPPPPSSSAKQSSNPPQSSSSTPEDSSASTPDQSSSSDQPIGNTCPLSPSDGVSNWGTCKKDVPADSACSFGCDAGYNKIAGYCKADGTWRTKPYCQKTSAASEVAVASVALLSALALL